MKVVLLSSATQDEVPAGVEHYSALLSLAFPSLQIIRFSDVHGTLFPFLSEPSKACALSAHLSGKLEEISPDLVLYNGMMGWALPPERPYATIGIGHGTFSSFARQAMSLSLNQFRMRFVYSWFEKKSLRKADACSANSRFTQSLLKKEYDVASELIYPTLDFERFKPQDQTACRQKLGLPLGKKIVLFVGRPDYSKGFDLVESLAHRNPNLLFVSVTFPKSDSPHLLNIGPVSFENMATYYSASDCVLFPTRFEGFGFVTAEALALNRPVVTTPVGIAPEISPLEGLFVENPVLLDIEQAIFRALALEKIQTRSVIQSRFSTDFFCESYTGLVSQAVKKHES